MALSFPTIRLVLYASFLLWAFLLFVLCIGRLAYTNTPRQEKSLNNGQPFYDPSIVELLVCSILGLGFVATMWLIFRRRITYNSPVSKAWFEIVVLFVLWMLWVGGAGAAVSVWPDLSWCVQYGQCRLLQAIMGFAWLGWICITLLLGGSLVFAAGRQAWTDESVDTWGSMGGITPPSNAGHIVIPEGRNVEMSSHNGRDSQI